MRPFIADWMQVDWIIPDKSEMNEEEEEEEEDGAAHNRQDKNRNKLKSNEYSTNDAESEHLGISIHSSSEWNYRRIMQIGMRSPFPSPPHLPPPTEKKEWKNETATTTRNKKKPQLITKMNRGEKKEEKEEKEEKKKEMRR